MEKDGSQAVKHIKRGRHTWYERIYCQRLLVTAETQHLWARFVVFVERLSIGFTLDWLGLSTFIFCLFGAVVVRYLQPVALRLGHRVELACDLPGERDESCRKSERPPARQNLKTP